MADMEPQMEMKTRPSFFATVMSGISGYFKGALSGGLAGIVGGALAGLAIGAVVVATHGAAAGFAHPIAHALLGAAGLGATIGGSALASIGAVAGTMTGVVKSREAAQPTADDIVNVAKVSFASGVQLGQVTTKNRDRLANERSASLGEPQIG